MKFNYLPLIGSKILDLLVFQVSKMKIQFSIILKYLPKQNTTFDSMVHLIAFQHTTQALASDNNKSTLVNTLVILKRKIAYRKTKF